MFWKIKENKSKPKGSKLTMVTVCIEYKIAIKYSLFLIEDLYICQQLILMKRFMQYILQSFDKHTAEYVTVTFDKKERKKEWMKERKKERKKRISKKLY